MEKPRRIYLRSFGCPTNLADGEFMVGCLSAVGYKLVEKVEDADVLVYNTCAVKTPTENRILDILKKSPSNKKIIITGCLPLINFERLSDEIRFDAVLGSALGRKIVDVIRKVESGESIINLENNLKPSLDLPRTPTNSVIGIIPVNYGCLGRCSFCCVHFARGHLRSYSINEAIKRAKQDLSCGARELWLTSQDVACYGRDINTNLANLLVEICKIKKRFFIRVGMMTPNCTLELLDALIKAYKNEKVYKFLHLPVQSGDNAVLTLMNRSYSVDVFKRIVNTFRNKIPRVTIATDVICGFPCEGEEAFERTMELIKEIQPDVVNISKFFPRPNTGAGQMKLLSNQIVKDRSRRMTKLVRDVLFEKNKSWLGWAGKILVSEKGNDPYSWIGRNFAYKPIVIKKANNLLGKFLVVRVVKAFPTYLEAEIV